MLEDREGRELFVSIITVGHTGRERCNDDDRQATSTRSTLNIRRDVYPKTTDPTKATLLKLSPHTPLYAGGLWNNPLVVWTVSL